MMMMMMMCKPQFGCFFFLMDISMFTVWSLIFLLLSCCKVLKLRFADPTTDILRGCSSCKSTETCRRVAEASLILVEWWFVHFLSDIVFESVRCLAWKNTVANHRTLKMADDFGTLRLLLFLKFCSKSVQVFHVKLSHQCVIWKNHVELGWCL